MPHRFWFLPPIFVPPRHIWSPRRKENPPAGQNFSMSFTKTGGILPAVGFFFGEGQNSVGKPNWLGNFFGGLEYKKNKHQSLSRRLPQPPAPRKIPSPAKFPQRISVLRLTLSGRCGLLPPPVSRRGWIPSRRGEFSGGASRLAFGL